MLSWETGVQFGQALEQLRHHEERITQTEKAVAEVREEVTTIRGYLMRALLLVLLWAAGIGGNMTAETVGSTIAETIRALKK